MDERRQKAENVTPHFHDDRVADARGGSLFDRTILGDGVRRLVLHSLGFGGRANRPQISLIHLRSSVQRPKRHFQIVGVTSRKLARYPHRALEFRVEGLEGRASAPPLWDRPPNFGLAGRTVRRPTDGAARETRYHLDDLEDGGAEAPPFQTW